MSARLLFKLGLFCAATHRFESGAFAISFGASTGLPRCATEHPGFFWQRKWCVLERTVSRQISERMEAKSSSGAHKECLKKGYDRGKNQRAIDARKFVQTRSDRFKSHMICNLVLQYNLDGKWNRK